MRSWSKCVSFSRKIKSSIKVGPRKPAFSEFWLSPTGTPWLVVSTQPLSSLRAPSRDALRAFSPSAGWPAPVFAEGIVSPAVLAVASASPVATCTPSTGVRAASPYWPSSLGLTAMAAASCWLAAVFCSSARVTSLSAPRLCGAVLSDGPDMLLRMEPAPSVDGVFLLLAMTSPVSSLPRENATNRSFSARTGQSKQ